ncbi:GNAT family N-acetyltransferase [Anaerosporobacter faecicola]|nr:GNAT family N-acetyltransferase [Anaerosporobacter faecicola]
MEKYVTVFGYGTKLLSMLIQASIQQMGYKKVILNTSQRNLRVQHVYE